MGFLDGRPAGFVQNFRTGTKLNWKVSGQGTALTAEDRERQAHDALERQRERLQKRERGYEQAAAKADALWTGARPVQTHPYLMAKGVASHGLREGAPGQTITSEDGDGKPREISIAGRLLVPVRDAAGDLASLQFIRRDGSKMFMPDGRAASRLARALGISRSGGVQPLRCRDCSNARCHAWTSRSVWNQLEICRSEIAAPIYAEAHS